MSARPLLPCSFRPLRSPWYRKVREQERFQISLREVDRVRGLTCLSDCPWSKQAITTTKNRLQQFTVGPERLANREYVDPERTAVDRCIRPNAIDQVVLFDEFTTRLD
jgi:hypothetical protein